jgi:hypothetical protein
MEFNGPVQLHVGRTGQESYDAKRRQVIAWLRHRRPPHRWLVGLVLFLNGAVGAGASDGVCSAADREALFVGALHHEVNATIWQTKARCTVVAISRPGASQADPPLRAMLRLRRFVRSRLIGISEAEKCPDAPRTWVAEPLCHGRRAQVRTQQNDHCPLLYQRVGSRWEPGVSGACE